MCIRDRLEGPREAELAAVEGVLPAERERARHHVPRRRDREEGPRRVAVVAAVEAPRAVLSVTRELVEEGSRRAPRPALILSLIHI